MPRLSHKPMLAASSDRDAECLIKRHAARVDQITLQKIGAALRIVGVDLAQQNGETADKAARGGPFGRRRLACRRRPIFGACQRGGHHALRTMGRRCATVPSNRSARNASSPGRASRALAAGPGAIDSRQRRCTAEQSDCRARNASPGRASRALAAGPGAIDSRQRRCTAEPSDRSTRNASPGRASRALAAGRGAIDSRQRRCTAEPSDRSTRNASPGRASRALAAGRGAIDSRQRRCTAEPSDRSTRNASSRARVAERNALSPGRASRAQAIGRGATKRTPFASGDRES